MSLVIEQKIVSEDVVVGFKCHKCHKLFFDDMEIQEMVRFKNTGGYGCAFGDGVEYEICFCTDCAFEVLDEYTAYQGE